MKNAQESWMLYCSGENAALRVLFDELILPLQYSSYYFTKDWQQSQDIVGDVFLMLMEADDKQRRIWQTKNDCFSFLKVVTKYKSIDWVRQQANQQRLHQLMDWPMAEKAKISSDDLKEYALSMLNPKEQKFLNDMIDGKTVEEISQESAVSEKTVRNNLSLIRLKLNRIRNLIPFLFP